MDVVELRAGKFELPARFERNRAAAGDVEQADNIRPFHDWLPAEQMLHPFQERADGARPFVSHRTMTFEREREFLVLGTDAELRFGFDPLRKPGHEFFAPLDRRQVDLITRHGESRVADSRIPES